jgi:hypothetical protein
MLDSSRLPKSPKNMKQGVQDPHFQVQHLAPVIARAKMNYYNSERERERERELV